MTTEERIVLDAANKMEAAFQCGPRDVQRFAAIIREAIRAAFKAEQEKAKQWRKLWRG